MMWLKKLLRKWVVQATQEAAPKLSSNAGWAEAISNPSPVARPDSPPECQVTLRKAMNGYFLELAQHRPQQRGPDWQYSYFVLESTADLAPAIAALLVKQRLEQ